MSDYWYAGGGIGLGPRADVLEREPYPAPEVTSRDGVTGPAKTAVDSLVRTVWPSFGFWPDVRYARGHFPHASHGTPGELKESLAVVMTRGSQRAVAVYAGSGKSWSWDTLAIQGSGAWPRRFNSLAAFLDGLLGPIHQPVKAVSPMEGPARRALKVHGPLMP
jgi:hypothetical protein